MAPMVKMARKPDRIGLKKSSRVGRKRQATKSVTSNASCRTPHFEDPNRISSLIQRLVPDANFGDIKAVVSLLSEGHSLPYIARYRREDVGQVSEKELRDIHMSFEPAVRLFKAQRVACEKIMSETDTEMSEMIVAEIENTFSVKEVTDVVSKYVAPEKPAKQILMERAIQDTVALSYSRIVLDCWKQDCKHFLKYAGEISNVETLVSAAIFSRNECMQVARIVLRRACSNQLSLKAHQWLALGREGKAIPSFFQIEHSDLVELVLAIFRSLAPTHAEIKQLNAAFVPAKFSCVQILTKAIRTCAVDLIVPCVRREWVRELNARSESESLEYFSTGLRSKLLQRGVHVQGNVFGIDPGLASGCKVVVLDCAKENMVIATFKINSTINRINTETFENNFVLYSPHLLVLGDGTGSLEMRRFLAAVVPQANLCVVSEAGASRYSVSELSMAELPQLPIEYRGCVSIARRALDPLSEHTKIEPQHLSVGMYQHEIPKKTLNKYLRDIVSDCVAQVGIDLNTASETILSLVPGLNKATAASIVQYRKGLSNGFRNRFELIRVKGIGPVTFSNCAGFLLVRDSNLTPLDNTAVHPDDYPGANYIVQKHAEFLHLYSPKIESSTSPVNADLEADILRLLTISDPRENTEPIQVRPAAQMAPRDSELQPTVGSICRGTVCSIASFGAFIKITDAAFRDDGLLHISQYPIGVTDPHYYRTGQELRVQINSMVTGIGNSSARSRIGLTTRF